MRLIIQSIMLLTIAVLCPMPTAVGQEPSSAREQLEMLPPPPESESPTTEGQEEKPADDGSDELGPIVVLQRAPRYQPFRAYSDTQYLYNSNVLLTDSVSSNSPVADGVFVETLGASYAPRLVKGLASTFYARQQFIRYATKNNYDFDAQTAGLNLQRPVRNWFIVSSGFEASRYFLREHSREFLKEMNLSLGIRRGQYLRQRVFAYYGYQFNWLPTSPSDLSRLDNALFVGLNIAFLQQLQMQLAYRLRGLSYYQNTRFDYDHSLNATLTYKFNNYINVRGFVSYAANDSDQTGHDYQGLSAGGGLGLSVQF